MNQAYAEFQFGALIRAAMVRRTKLVRAYIYIYKNNWFIDRK
jgi:hypothetical protein